LYFYTDKYKYCISARDSKANPEDSYLGCTLSDRNVRPGEYWLRGSDYPDGKLSLETWNRIKERILSDVFVLPPKFNKDHYYTEESLFSVFELLIKSILGVYKGIASLKHSVNISSLVDSSMDIRYASKIKKILTLIGKELPEGYHPIFLACDNEILREVFKELGGSNGNS
jgi:hypothetical protein